MGLTVSVKNDIVNSTQTMTYKCSKCGRNILKTPPVELTESIIYDNFFIWNNIPTICVCGEKLLGLVTKLMPIIDVISNE